MDSTKLTLSVTTSDAATKLAFDILLDDQVVYTKDHVQETHTIECDIPDDEADHVLVFQMRNKQQSDTTVDGQGNIVKDARLTITDIAFENIKLGQIVIDHAVYQHDFNGTQEPVQAPFYGEMGCNGTVTLKFTTPVYLWLLENM